MTPNETQPEPPDTPQTLLTEADAQAARLVTERLNEITRRATQTRRRLIAIYTLAFVVWVFGGVIQHILSWNGSPLKETIELFRLLFMFITLPLAAVVKWRGTPKFDAEELAKMGGVQAIAPLMATLQTALPTNRKQAIYDALTILLPQMQASNANLLTPPARHTLYTWLNSATDYSTIDAYPDNLRISALKALEQVGDSTSIPVVMQLTNMNRLAARHAKVKQAAIDCLPMLRANCGEVETARTLLRASQAGEARPDTLLRPANGAGNTDAAELLRGSGASNKQE